MKILITGACGFVGGVLARAFVEEGGGHQILGLDNLVRPGSETNRAPLKALGVQLCHGDLRSQSDVDALPPVDYVIDAAANPSVLAGVDGQTSSRQLLEHNLLGTVNLLEYCRRHRAGFILLSTSRVYSIPPLATLPVVPVEEAFLPQKGASLPSGVTVSGIGEGFSTASPVSLYGATKLASETLALEYGATFGFPVFVNRCGVLAGAGQFGRADQGIFSYWINRYCRRLPLKYIGFGGHGYQVRDCLHSRDLLPLLKKQMEASTARESVLNVSGGAASAMSLRQLSAWCEQRFGPHPVQADPAERPFDLPWVVLDSTRAKGIWGWSPATPVRKILEEIAVHAEQNPRWLEMSSP